MTYALSPLLQTALYERLTGDPAVTALLGDAVYDALPSGTLPPLYALLGAEDVRDASDQTGSGADHSLQITLLAQTAGFASAKTAAAAICDALLGAPLTLPRGYLAGFHFTKARAARLGDGRRQITLTFRARLGQDT